MSDVQEATSYEANTVEELRDELRARDLPVSGHKDELIARLEEDDAAKAGEAEAGEAEQQDEGLPPDVQDPYKRVYSPWELPANTAAAQAFMDANPEIVDQDLRLPDEQLVLAQASIQDHVDYMASIGVTVEDSRLEGYTPPEPPQQEEAAATEEANA